MSKAALTPMQLTSTDKVSKMANVDVFYEEYNKEVGAFDELVTRLRNSFSVEDGTNKQQLIVEIESKYKR